MKIKNLKKLIKQIKKSKRVAIFAHTEPDFDAISSALSLKYALNKINIESDYIINEKLSDKALLFYGENCFKNKFNKSDYDFFISVDTPVLDRTMCPELFTTQTNSFVIDHHKNLGMIGKYNFIDSNYSSCAEMVYEFIQKLKIKIDIKIATVLYAGLSADTGSFVNSNTNTNSFIVAGNLKKLGANTEKFNEMFYKSSSIKDLNIKKFVLNNIVFTKNIAYCLVTQNDIKELKADPKDFHISNQLIKFDKVKIAFSIIEKEPNIYYVSFRSKEGFPMREVAERLGGGGHLYACACKLSETKPNIHKIKNMVIKEINNYLKKSNKTEV